MLLQQWTLALVDLESRSSRGRGYSGFPPILALVGVAEEWVGGRFGHLDLDTRELRCSKTLAPVREREEM